MVETISTFLQDHHISKELIVFIISMLPILELRGGLLAAAFMGVPWQIAVPICLVGNMLPVPFIIFFIERILKFLQQHGPIKKIATWFEEKAMKKGAEMMEKYPRRIQLGLFLFVAIPLPGTGAWTGALIAAFLGLPPKRSAPAICLGVLGACAIMLTITYVIPYFVGRAL